MGDLLFVVWPDGRDKLDETMREEKAIPVTTRLKKRLEESQILLSPGERLLVCNAVGTLGQELQRGDFEIRAIYRVAQPMRNAQRVHVFAVVPVVLDQQLDEPFTLKGLP